MINFKLLSLSNNAFNNICHFIDKKAILNLRQICISSMHKVATFVSSSETKLGYLQYFPPEADNTILLKFGVRNPRDVIFWKLSFLFTCKKLNLDHTTHIKWHLEAIDYQREEFEVTLALAELEPFLLRLKSYVSNAIFPTMYFVLDEMTANVIHIFQQFFEGQTVPRISIAESNVESFDTIIEFIHSSQVNDVMCRFDMLLEAHLTFIYKIANMVKSMSLHFMNLDISTQHHSIIKQILTRNCETVDFFCVSNPISQSGLEKLIKILHQLDKKAYVRVSMRDPPIFEQYGLYTIRSLPSAKFASIIHVNRPCYY